MIKLQQNLVRTLLRRFYMPCCFEYEESEICRVQFQLEVSEISPKNDTFEGQMVYIYHTYPTLVSYVDIEKGVVPPILCLLRSVG